MTVLLIFQVDHVSFSFLIAMARTSKTLLNYSGQIGDLFLVPDFRGNAFVLFTFECDVTSGFFIYGPYYIEVCSILFFSKNQLLASFVISIVCFVSISFISALILMNYFFQLTPGFFCSFCSCFRYKVSLISWEFSCFLR